MAVFSRESWATRWFIRLQASSSCPARTPTSPSLSGVRSAVKSPRIIPLQGLAQGADLPFYPPGGAGIAGQKAQEGGGQRQGRGGKEVHSSRYPSPRTVSIRAPSAPSLVPQAGHMHRQGIVLNEFAVEIPHGIQQLPAVSIRPWPAARR